MKNVKEINFNVTSRNLIKNVFCFVCERVSDQWNNKPKVYLVYESPKKNIDFALNVYVICNNT